MTTYRAWNLKPLDRSALKELTAAIAQQSTEELETAPWKRWMGSRGARKNIR